MTLDTWLLTLDFWLLTLDYILKPYSHPANLRSCPPLPPPSGKYSKLLHGFPTVDNDTEMTTIADISMNYVEHCHEKMKTVYAGMIQGYHTSIDGTPIPVNNSFSINVPLDHRGDVKLKDIRKSCLYIICLFFLQIWTTTNDTQDNYHWRSLWDQRCDVTLLKALTCQLKNELTILAVET